MFVNIFSDIILRLGTSEVTRLGMKEEEMKQIAHFIRRIVVEDESPKRVKPDVQELVSGFQEVHYSFDEWLER